MTDLQQTFNDFAYNGEQSEMIKLISQNPTYKFGFNRTLYWACYGEQKEIAEWLIETYNITQFNEALYEAFINDKKEIIKLLINKCPINYIQFEKYVMEEFCETKDIRCYDILREVKDLLKEKSTQVIIETD